MSKIKSHASTADVQIENINMVGLDREAYSKFLLSSDGATIFHSYEWCKLIGELFDFDLHFLVAMDKFGNYLAVLPLAYVKNILNKKLYSFPFSPYSGFIGDEKYFKNLFEKSIEFKESLGCKQIVIAQSPFAKLDKNPCREAKEKRWLSQYIIVEKPQVMWLRFRPRVRKTIKRSVRKGVTVENLDLNECYKIKDIYRLLMKLSKRRGFFILSYKDNLKIWKTLHASGYLKILIAEKDGKIIGFVSFLKFKDTIFCKEGALSEEGKKLGAHPLIIWEGLKWSYNVGCKIFDLGPSSPLLEDGFIIDEFKGLVKFKSSFGAIPARFSYFYYPNHNLDWMNNEQTVIRIKKMVRYIPDAMIFHLGTFLVKDFM